MEKRDDEKAKEAEIMRKSFRMYTKNKVRGATRASAKLDTTGGGYLEIIPIRGKRIIISPTLLYAAGLTRSRRKVR